MVCDCLVFDLSWKKHLCLWGIYQLEGAWFLSSMSWGIYVLHKNNLDYWTTMTLKVLEVLGIDPSTSRMLSERSTIWATPPCWRLGFLIKYFTLFLIMVQNSLNCEMIGTKWSLFIPLHIDCSITGQDNSWDLLKIIRHWKFQRIVAMPLKHF